MKRMKICLAVIIICSSSTLYGLMHEFTITAHINNGGWAAGVTVAPDGTIFLANWNDGLRAYKYKGSSFTNTAHINNGGTARYVAIGLDGTVFLANGEDGLRAYNYNGSSLINTGHVDDGGFAYGVEVGSDGTIYLANGDDGLRAYVFNGSSFSNTAHINDGGSAIGTAVSSSGTIFLANYHDGLRAYTFNGSSFFNTAHIDDGGWAWRVALGSGNTVYLANNGDGLRAYSYNGTSFSNTAHVNPGGWAVDVAVGFDGTIFLANWDGGYRAYTYDGSSFTSTAHIYNGGAARGVALGSDGTVFLANEAYGLYACAYSGYFQKFIYFVRASHTSLSDEKRSIGCAWSDYDLDGDPDLFVANIAEEKNNLYINNGEGNFTGMTTGDVVTDGGRSQGGTWGDYNNDGYPDLFVSNANGEDNFLYENTNGVLNRVGVYPLTSDGGNSNGAAWGDYDSDGYLDLFVANGGENNFLYHNNGNGTFSKVTTGPIVTNGGASTSGAWCDYDLDGDLDLFVANTGIQTNFLYNNNGDGTFTRITSGAIVEDGFEAYGGSWGDYDNDGYPDLYVPHSGQNNCLYRNNGYGAFIKITYGDLVNDNLRAKSSGWGDVNKDGYLDLFVSNSDSYSHLHLNNGDGTFTRYVIHEPINAWGGSWCDYNLDGKPDLFLCNFGASNVLLGSIYHDNNWLKVKCEGTISNRGGIGAKVRIGVNDVWQMREISSQTGFGGQSSPIAFFGIGDATSVDQVRVLWPSGMISEINHVSSNQLLVVTETDPIPNTPPIAQNDSLTIYEDSTVVIHVLSNDTDPDGDDLFILGLDQTGITGTAQIDPGDTTIQYIPPAGFVGSDSFEYIISDNRNGLDTAKVFIEILSLNLAPIAQNDTISINQDSVTTIFVLSNDTDPNGDPLVIQSLDNINAPGVVIVNSGDTSITYAPEIGFSGNANFDYIISDNRGGMDTATVFINILIGNRPPIAQNDTLTIQQDSVVTIYPLMNDTDPDGDSLTIAQIGDIGTSGMLVINSGDSSITYLPTIGFSGSVGFFYVISDGNGGMDDALITITVTPKSAVMDQNVPSIYALFQNFPNPFNPVTTISYALPKKSRVILRIFSITGSEIRTLIDEEKSAGSYKAIWDARDRFGRSVGSGIYFYQLNAGTFTERRKMLLVR